MYYSVKKLRVRVNESETRERERERERVWRTKFKSDDKKKCNVKYIKA